MPQTGPDTELSIYEETLPFEREEVTADEFDTTGYM